MFLPKNLYLSQFCAPCIVDFGVQLYSWWKDVDRRERKVWQDSDLPTLYLNISQLRRDEKENFTLNAHQIFPRLLVILRMWCDLSIIHFWLERHLKGFGWNSFRSESKTNAIWGSWFNLYPRLFPLLPTFNEFHNLQNPVFFATTTKVEGGKTKICIIHNSYKIIFKFLTREFLYHINLKFHII